MSLSKFLRFDEPLSNRRNLDEEYNNHLHFAEPVSLQAKLDVENTATLLFTHKELEEENQDFQRCLGQGKVVADRTNDIFSK